MNVHYLTHVPYEGLGEIEPWLKTRNHRISQTKLYAGEPLPDPGGADWLIIMGGPMGVHDEMEFPWLRAEKRHIEMAIEQKKKVLGICLGAQLIADVLGSRVSPHRNREIGWFPVFPTPDGVRAGFFRDGARSVQSFHWHGDSFSLPDGAVHLVQSEACEQQGFLYDQHVLGLQFHPEANAGTVDLMLEHASRDLVPGPFVQSETEIRAGKIHASGQLLNDILSGLFEKSSAPVGVG